MPRRKISKRKSIVRKLDKIVSLIIRKTTPYCVVCGTTEYLQNGHMFSRMAYNTRWDISKDGNCHTQCRGCNLRHERDFYHYSNWYIEKFGKDKYDVLHRRYRTVNKFSTPQLEDLYLELKEHYDNLQ